MIGAVDVPELRTEEVVCEEYFKIESPWRRGKPKVDGKSHRTGEMALVMGVDKRKARRQRNIHLSVVCGKAADMSRDLVYVNLLLSFVRPGTEKTNGY